jgi:uncharacterized protein YbjT (DUF2867 family)
MNKPRKTVLVVGSTGSIGHLVVEEAVRQGYIVRALVRTPSKARKFPAPVEVISGDVTRPETLTAAVDAVDAIVFTLGSDGKGKAGAEAIGGRPAIQAMASLLGARSRKCSFTA